MYKKIRLILIAVVALFCQMNVEAAEKEDCQVSYQNNKLTITGVAENTPVEVTNMLGLKVLTFKTVNGKNEVTADLGKGFYIVRIGYQTIKRIIVR